MLYNFFFPPFFYFITSLSLAGSMPCIYLWCNTIMYSHRHVASIFCESACPHYLLVPKGTPKLLVDIGTRIYFGWAHTKWVVGEIFMVAIKLYIYIYIFILILILFSWELISKGHNKIIVWECCINLFLLSCVMSKLTTRMGKIR